MAKSSYAMALLFAGWSGAAAAAPPSTGLLTAEEAMKHYHETFGVSAKGHCPDLGATDEEIVICGRPHAPLYRLPLPIERAPGEIVRHGGDAGGGVAAMNAGGCMRACQEPVKFDVVKLLFNTPKI